MSTALAEDLVGHGTYEAGADKVDAHNVVPVWHASPKKEHASRGMWRVTRLPAAKEGSEQFAVTNLFLITCMYISSYRKNIALWIAN